MADTQEQLILQFLRRHGSITSNQAFEQLGITRLPARIHDLRQAGYNIESMRIEVSNRRGDKCHVSRYSLKEKL